MSVFSRNIVANVIGKLLPAVIGLLVVPVYVRLMGVESYGLVGLFASLQSVLGLLDLGLSTTANRELARLSAQAGTAQEARDLVRTLERVYWGLAAVIALAVAALAPWLSESWLQSAQLSTAAVQHAIVLMGLAIALQFPATFYGGGLGGLQRQVAYNGIAIAVGVLRAIGAVVILTWVSPTIGAFLACQVVMSAVLTIVTGWRLWASLPSAQAPARFRPALLSGVRRFAAEMTGISILAVILTQLDKLILSRMLTLEQFGYYSLATVLATGLYLLASPVYTAAFPRFSQLISSGDHEGLRRLYHTSCQLVAAIVLPAALAAAVFSRELLYAWTGNLTTAEAAHQVLSLLMLGTALNTLAITPYTLQLAYGWTRLALVQNAVAVACLVPLIVAMTVRYGAAGAAGMWILLNAGYVSAGLAIMHRRILPGELSAWYLVDTGRPLIAALAVALIFRWMMPPGLARFALLGWMGMVFCAAFAAAVAAAPHPRQWLWRLFISKKPALAGSAAS